jgi:hypothetical protein
MDGKGLRTILIFGVVATLLLTMMMMFSLDQVADTETPQIAADLAREFAPSLAEGGEGAEAPVHLTMTRDGPGFGARRVYKLRLRPSADVAAEPSAVARLMYHGAEYCAALIGDPKGDVAIRCIAELPDGGTKETMYLRDRTGAATQIIKEVAELPPQDAPGAEKR